MWLDVLGWGEAEVNDLRFVAYSYIKQGHYALALTFFEALAVLCPDSSYDIQTLGALHLEIGDPLTALGYLDQALRHDPDHAPTLLNRAKTLLLLGYHSQGIAQATLLGRHPDANISGPAEALIMAYTDQNK